jgi:DNA-binding XRE family transcriptional regulator
VAEIFIASRQMIDVPPCIVLQIIFHYFGNYVELATDESEFGNIYILPNSLLANYIFFYKLLATGNFILKCWLFPTINVILWIISDIMKSKKQILFPKYQKILEQVGENIRLARKRRSLTTIQVAERAAIDRSTLYEIEKGNSSVSLGAYFNTLRVLGLQDDFLKLAADDNYGRKLQDLQLTK